MKRITRVQINNFKFFPDAKPIEIDGKNILLYGENGSGKSSFYWALYTLLECSSKTDPTQIQKYFNKFNSEGLVNIHAQVNEDGVDNSFIKITLDDDSSFEVSHSNTSINQNSDAKESLLASDFLNYRLLQRAHSVKHSEDIDLFPLFEEAVLSYVQFDPTNWHNSSGATIQLNDASSIYEVVKSGPDKTYPRKSLELGYPQKGAHNAAYTEFTNLVERFERGLTTLIQGINNRVNSIIQDKLNFSISFHLEYNKLSDYELTIAQYTPPQYTIQLVIDSFNGIGPIHKPQSFLNEARLSAISLAIRLAILEIRFPDAPVKILVLDDLMISLDMSNRDKVVKMILEDYSWWRDDQGNDIGHQTFILTHDRSLFTFIKNDISSLPPQKSATWKLIEMYADDIDENDSTSYEKPVIFDSETEFRKAYNHYKNHDYPSAANYLRKHSEKILSDFLPTYCWQNSNKEEKSNSKVPLDSILNNGIIFWDLFGIDNQEYKKLRKYVSVLLNPLSHADVGVERYKKEIKDVMDTLVAIEQMHSKFTWTAILAGGEHVEVQLMDGSCQTYLFRYELNSSFYKLSDNHTEWFSRFDSRMIYYCLKDSSGNTIKDGDFDGKTSDMKDNYDECIRRHSLTGSIKWMDDLFDNDGKKII